MDGAVGTQLYAAGVSIDACFDELSVSHPDVVSAIHRGYIAAGADIIETNSFGANRIRLEQFGFEERGREFNIRAVKVAREAREVSGRTVFVAGSIGPSQRTLEPFGTLRPNELAEAAREQIDALLEGGVDLLCIETISDIDEMRIVLQAARAACDLPVIALMTFAEDGRTVKGQGVDEVAAALIEAGATVIGANCSVGPNRILPVAAAMVRRVAALGQEHAVASVPNAGWPTRIAGRVMFPSSAAYFAEFARDATAAGVRVVGGCCGTTPEHIRAMRDALDDAATPPSAKAIRLLSAREERTAELVAPEGPTEFARKLGNVFLTCVEIDPPKGLRPEKALDGARMLKEVGVDAINVADSPMARVRMSAMTLSYLIQHEIGVESIVHFTTRDRSLMGLQSELLGAHAVGVRNILALTGDPPSLGDYPDSSAVYDVDSIGLVRVLSRLNGGTDSAGAPIGQMASFTIGCAVDPTRSDLVEEARRLRAKLDAGAHFVMTQPIFDIAVWHRFLDVFGGPIDRPVMIGILPLQSSRHAEFLHNEVPGITLTDAARDRMRRAGPEGRAEGVTMARDLLAELAPQVQGVYIMPSFGRYEVAAEVLQGVVLARRTNELLVTSPVGSPLVS